MLEIHRNACILGKSVLHASGWLGWLGQLSQPSQPSQGFPKQEDPDFPKMHEFQKKIRISKNISGIYQFFLFFFLIRGIFFEIPAFWGNQALPASSWLGWLGQLSQPSQPSQRFPKQEEPDFPKMQEFQRIYTNVYEFLKNF